MRALRPVLAGALSLALLAALPAAASHDDATHTDNIRVAGHDAFGYGTDIAFRGNVAVTGSGYWDVEETSGIYLHRIGRNGEPRRLSFTACASWHADVDFVGRYVVQSHDDPGSNLGCQPGEGKQGVRVFDVSQNGAAASIGFAETIHGSHNLTAVGDTGLVYVASYNLGDPTDVDGVSIVDVAANPENPPVTFLEFPDADNSPAHPDMENRSGRVPTSPGCHDIGLDLDRDLAFCAAITETHVWDISDPRNPAIVAIIVNPAINIHHGALPNADGDVLVINDEWLGAAGGPTGCVVQGAPVGALWFYDIADPTSPALQSFWAPPNPDPTADFCTSHFFDPFDDRDWLVTSWYDHGIFVVDFSDPAAPAMVAQYDPGDATYWSAYAERGFIYAASFAPATLTGSDPAIADDGGLWVFELDGYSRSDP